MLPDGKLFKIKKKQYLSPILSQTLPCFAGFQKDIGFFSLDSLKKKKQKFFESLGKCE